MEAKTITCFFSPFKKQSCVNVTEDVKLKLMNKRREKELLIPHYQETQWTLHDGFYSFFLSFFLSFFFIIASNFPLKRKRTQIVIRKANIDLVNRIRQKLEGQTKNLYATKSTFEDLEKG